MIHPACAWSNSSNSQSAQPWKKFRQKSAWTWSIPCRYPKLFSLRCRYDEVHKRRSMKRVFWLDASGGRTMKIRKSSFSNCMSCSFLAYARKKGRIALAQMITFLSRPINSDFRFDLTCGACSRRPNRGSRRTPGSVPERYAARVHHSLFDSLG